MGGGQAEVNRSQKVTQGRRTLAGFRTQDGHRVIDILQTFRGPVGRMDHRGATMEAGKPVPNALRFPDKMRMTALG